MSLKCYVFDLFFYELNKAEAMIKKAFLTELFRAADMRRWNDKIRHIELRELDYQAQKMAIAYVLAKWEELKNPNTVDWITLIERAFLNFLNALCSPTLSRRYNGK